MYRMAVFFMDKFSTFILPENQFSFNSDNFMLEFVYKICKAVFFRKLNYLTNISRDQIFFLSYTIYYCKILNIKDNKKLIFQ